MPDITILEVPVFSTLCNAAFALRREVFIVEQKVPADEEFTPEDLTATHLAALVAGNVVGTLRIVYMQEHVKIGRVVVRFDHRGMGVAKKMLVHAMELARARGETRFFLTAQSDKLAVYEKLGFVAYGEEFDDSGMPHYAMKTY